MPEVIDQVRAVLTRKCPHCEAGMGFGYSRRFHFDATSDPPKCQRPNIDPAVRDALLLALLEHWDALQEFENSEDPDHGRIAARGAAADVAVPRALAAFVEASK